MLGKIARKVYALLGKRPSAHEAAVRQGFEELTKLKAPNNFGAREEFPGLPKAFPPHATGIRVGENQAIAQLYTGQKIFVDTRDISLAPHLMVDGVWEAHITRALATLLKEEDVFFDIGANVGYYTCVAATRLLKTHDRVNIHAFEPNPDLAELLRKTMSVNGLGGTARVTSAGLAEKEGELTLHRNSELWAASSFRKELAHAVKANDTKVPVTTLDAYCRKHKIEKVDVVKLDVEGYEDHVYAGMTHTIKHNPHIRLLMEFTFDAYENEAEFFAQLQKDFAYMYYVDQLGEFEFITDYKALHEKTHDAQVMIVLTNKELA